MAEVLPELKQTGPKWRKMMEESYHATTPNRFYPDMSNVNKNIIVEAKLFSPPTKCNSIPVYEYIITFNLNS
jgi:hypothetical protein